MSEEKDTEITRLTAELAEWTQAASVEAQLSREAHEEIARLKKALEPFAEAATWYDRDYCTGDVILWQSRYSISVILKVDDLWNARDALKNQES